MYNDLEEIFHGTCQRTNKAMDPLEREWLPLNLVKISYIDIYNERIQSIELWC